MAAGLPSKPGRFFFRVVHPDLSCQRLFQAVTVLLLASMSRQRSANRFRCMLLPHCYGRLWASRFVRCYTLPGIRVVV